MSYQEYRLQYLDTMMELLERGDIDFQTASAQYWEDFCKWDERKKKLEKQGGF